MGIRSAPTGVVFDGQSLPVLPAAPNNFPTVAMASFPGVGWKNVSQAGADVAALTVSVGRRRVAEKANMALSVVFVLCEGTSDCANNNHTGLQMYDEQVVYANARRAEGYNIIVGCTLVRSEALMSAADNTERLDFNTRLLADASGAFDDVADFAVNATLADYTNNANYPDDIHFSVSAASVAGGIMVPVLDVYI